MLGVLIALVVGLLILCFLKQLWTQRSYPPGPLRLPIIGSIWQIGFKFDKDFFIKLAKKYGNIYLVWLGPFPVVVLSGYEAVKEVLRNHAEVVDRPETPFLKTIGKNRGIIFSNGHTWEKQRKFGLCTLRKLGLGKKGMEQKIEEEAYQLIQTFERAKGQPFDPTLPISISVSNVICALAFGHQFSVEDKEFLNLLEAIAYASEYMGTISYVLYELFPWIMERLSGLTKKVFSSAEALHSLVREEIKKHKQHQAVHEPQDFTDFYLLQMEKCKNDPNSTYNEDNLNQCVFDLFVAGTETLSLTLQWALIVMSNHQDIQEKVHQEIEDVLGPFQSFNYQDLKKMPYTNAVIHETRRFRYIFLHGVPRQNAKDMNVGGFLIPKKAIIVPDLRSVLLDPKQWETPEEFNPNHFLDKNGSFVEREAFLPFGAGARVCPGEQLARIELFIFFTSLLRTFTFRLPEGVKELNPDPLVGLSLAPSPYKLCAVPRNGSP